MTILTKLPYESPNLRTPLDDVALTRFTFVRWCDQSTFECIRDDGLRRLADITFASNTFVARSIDEGKHHIVQDLLEQMVQDAEEDGLPVPTVDQFKWSADAEFGVWLDYGGDVIAFASFTCLDQLLCPEIGGPN